jgi:hypothetical protein
MLYMLITNTATDKFFFIPWNGLSSISDKIAERQPKYITFEEVVVSF